MPRPTVAILCPREFKFTDHEASVERPFLDDVADLRTVWLDFNAPLPDDVIGANALILWHGPLITAPIIAKMQHCRAIIRNGVGFDTVDIAAAAQAGIPVCNVPDYGTEEVADHALALTLALYRQLFPLDAEAKRLGWKINVAAKMRRLNTQTFGLIGLGRIGTAAALRAKAFGFRVVFFDPYVTAGTHKALGIERVASLDDLLRRADTISVHCPLSAETRGLIGAREIGLLRPGAFIVNTARGDIVQKAPVFAALRSGHLGGAGLDVVEAEPLRTAEEAATPNLIVTCHAAFCSPEGMIEMRSTSARIARAAVLGEPVWNRVN
ncbi:C-terminal binding protein [Horticoccus sp. 23ND18S-11]|uniref:C-terminal binding protein n=1 Tax=Horticoccus sp. 23ND18S-11 TaxID=3391832 RepID=UPI0039C913D3